jgi:hypothetical protein
MAAEPNVEPSTMDVTGPPPMARRTAIMAGAAKVEPITHNATTTR